MKEKIKKAFNLGLFNILSATFINKIIAFVTNVLVVRVLAKSDYGCLTDAVNVLNIFVLFTGLGIDSGVLFFCSDKENPEKRTQYYRFACLYGTIIQTVLTVLMFVYTVFVPLGIENAKEYMLMLVPMLPCVFFFHYFSSVLRSRKENKKYSLLLNIQSISYSVLSVAGAYFANVEGTIIGRYLSYIVAVIIGYVFSRKFIKKSPNKVKLEQFEKKRIITYSFHSGMASAMNNILYRIDLFVISTVILNAAVLASYKVAAIVPENMNFIPQSIMIVAYPYFVENSDDKNKIKKLAKKIFGGMAILSGILTIVMVVFAPIIVKVLWGEDYADSIPCFRILAISFFFLSVFRSTSTNILGAMGRVKFNLIVSIITGVLNIGIDYFMVTRYGSIGAAIATLVVTIIASAISLPYLVRTIREIQ